MQFLFDESGVIYSNYGIIKGATKTIEHSQSLATTFLVTNNSYSYPNFIHDHLKSASIMINEPQIISSGHELTTDPQILNIIKGKTVYFLGRDESKQYILDAPIKSLSKKADEAEVIILANYTSTPISNQINEIIKAAQNNPNIPIICCNPDIQIRSRESLLKVMGHYANDI